MKPRVRRDFHEHHVRAPHLFYFIISVFTAFLISLIAMMGVVTILRILYPLG